MAGSMSAQDLKALLDSQTLYAVIDVRDWGEFSLGQIPGTNCIPRGSLEKYISVLVPKTDIHTVLYCDTGQRSTRAALSLETLGYTHVSVLDGGLTAWTVAGYETIHGWSLRGKVYGGYWLILLCKALILLARNSQITLVPPSIGQGLSLYTYHPRSFGRSCFNRALISIPRRNRRV